MFLHPLCQPHALFQQGMPFEVKGGGVSASFSLRFVNEKGEEILPLSMEVSPNGDFKAVFPAVKGSFVSYWLMTNDGEKIGPYSFGDVFLCVGQSNMSLPLFLTEDKEKGAKLLKEQPVYLFSVEDDKTNPDGTPWRSKWPLDQVGGGSQWQKIDGENGLSYSALGLEALSLLGKHLSYPVGFVLVASGGLSIDSLLSREVIKNDTRLLSYLKKTGKYLGEEDDYNIYGPGNNSQTCGIYNEKIHPLAGIKFKAVIYHQGENSAFDLESADYFRIALKALKDSYRLEFDQKDLPFFVMGIADEFYCYGDGYGYSYITEALSESEDENSIFVPISDIKPRWLVDDDNEINHPIHPSNKIDYATRLCDFLFHNLYEGRVYKAPRVKGMRVEKEEIILDVETRNPLVKETEFYGFAIAGEDGIYQPAKAVSHDGIHIHLHSDEIKHPQDCSYGLMQYSYLCTAKDDKGLPLIPFRNKKRSMDPLHDLGNPIAASCHALSLVENNFGASVGGGFEVPLWEKGSIYTRPEIGLSLDKEGIVVNAKLDRSCFGYLSLKNNLGIAGLTHRLGRMPYLSLWLKADSPLSFEGVYFRLAGKINKFPVCHEDGSTQGVLLFSQWQRYSVDLTKVLDGSEGPTVVDPELLQQLVSIEFAFHAPRTTEKIKLHIKDILFTKTKTVHSKQTTTEQTDSRIALPEERK